MNRITRKDFLKTLFYYTVSGIGIMGWSKFPTESIARAAEDSAAGGFEPAYLKLHQSGELKQRGDALWSMMKSCALCPRACGVDRLAGNEGFCQASSKLEISSFHPHYGEEPPLTGTKGSGTIYFSNCNLRCVFCINWKTNLEGRGWPESIFHLSDMMLYLQRKGCENINVVTPTHYAPHIVKALDIAAGNGLRLPVVYNTSGWERQEILKLLDGIVDIYLPDFKYSSSEMASKYSQGAFNYPEVTQQALLEMHRQVGVAKTRSGGIIKRGLMIRHLVMPNNVGGTKQVIDWIAANLPKDTYLNLMSQYRPHYRATDYPDIARRLHRQEYQDAVAWVKEAGLTNVNIQGDSMLL